MSFSKGEIGPPESPRRQIDLNRFGWTSPQPIAPGPDGGIQDTNGNYGTPMSGVVTVLP